MARLSKTFKALAAAGLMAAGSAALADPISLIIAVAQYALPAWAAFGVTIGAGLFRSNQAKKKARKERARQVAEYNAGLQDRTVQFSSTESSERLLYGSPAPIAGNIQDNLLSGDQDQFRHVLIDLVQHQCDGVEAIYCDGVEIGPLDSSGWVTGGEFYEIAPAAAAAPVVFSTASVVLPAVPVSGSVECYAISIEGSFNVPVTVSGSTVTCASAPDIYLQKTVQYKVAQGFPRLRVSMHLSPGGLDTADAYMMAQLPTKVTAAHKLSGHTYAWVTFDLRMDRFKGGPAAMTFKLRGKKVYDPRTALTAYSANPALCLMDYLRTRHGGAAPLAAFDAGWVSAANACDVAAYPAPPATPTQPYDDWKARTGGTPELFRCDALFGLDQGRESIIGSLEAACSGELSESAGLYRLRVGVWTPPVLTLADPDAFGFVEQVQGGNGVAETYNSARGNYLSANSLGSPQDAKEFVNSAFLAADGGEPRYADVPLGAIGSEQRAQHAMRLTVERSRAGRIFKLPAHPRCWPLQPGDRITWSYSPYAIAGETFRVTGWSQSLAGAPAIEITQDYPAIWDLANETNPFPQPVSALPSGFTAQAMVSLSANSGDAYLSLAGDGTVISGVALAWPAATDPYVRTGGAVQIEYRSVMDASGIWQTAPELPGDQTSVILQNLQDGLHHQFRARFKNQRGIGGAWFSITHFVIGKTAPPPPLDNLKVIEQPGGIRQLFWRSDNPPADLFSFEFAYILGTGTPAFAEMTRLGAKDRDARQLETIEPVGDGVYTFAAIQRDTSGNPSAPIYTQATLVADTFAAIEAAYFAHQEGWPGIKQDCSIIEAVLVNDGTQTWDGFDELTWDDLGDQSWDGAALSPMSYTHQIDRGTSGARTLRAATLSQGAATADLRTSADGVSWSAWAALPTGSVTSRFYQIRWTISGSNPELYRAQVIFYL